MYRSRVWCLKRSLIPYLIYCLLILLLSACTDIHTSTPASTSPTSVSTPGIASSPTSGSGNNTHLCPGELSTASYWETLLKLKGSPNRVEQMSCDHLIGDPTTQALVTVRRASGATRSLDVLVYTDLTSSNPSQIFALRGLVHGDAKISGYLTILTAERDPAAAGTHQANERDFAHDLFHEFAWSVRKETFVQVAFPGIYPDLTRYQAEADQAAVDQGHDEWKTAALLVARACVVNYLKWGDTTRATTLIGGGLYDLGAVIQVTSSDPGTRAVKVILRRLESNATTGIWIVSELQADGLSITTPKQLDTLNNPITITGLGTPVAGKIGTMSIWDHTLTSHGLVLVTGSASNPFSATTSYTPSAQKAAEEGIVMLFAANAKGNLPATAVTAKVLLGS